MHFSYLKSAFTDSNTGFANHNWNSMELTCEDRNLDEKNTFDHDNIECHGYTPSHPQKKTNAVTLPGLESAAPRALAGAAWARDAMDALAPWEFPEIRVLLHFLVIKHGLLENPL